MAYLGIYIWFLIAGFRCIVGMVRGPDRIGRIVALSILSLLGALFFHTCCSGLLRAPLTADPSPAQFYPLAGLSPYQRCQTGKPVHRIEHFGEISGSVNHGQNGVSSKGFARRPHMGPRAPPGVYFRFLWVSPLNGVSDSDVARFLGY